MNAQELVVEMIANSEYEILKVFEGLEERNYEYKSCKSAMTPLDTLVHLAEVCQAFMKETRGEKHEWGSYTAPDRTPAGAMKTFRALRKEAAEAAATQSGDALKNAVGYIALHEAYHLGQMCLVRMELDSSWNPLSIYKH